MIQQLDHLLGHTAGGDNQLFLKINAAHLAFQKISTPGYGTGCEPNANLSEVIGRTIVWDIAFNFHYIDQSITIAIGFANLWPDRTAERPAGFEIPRILAISLEDFRSTTQCKHSRCLAANFTTRDDASAISSKVNVP